MIAASGIPAASRSRHSPVIRSGLSLPPVEFKDLQNCDRILVLSEGRLTASFSRAEATEQKIMEAATIGARLAG